MLCKFCIFAQPFLKLHLKRYIMPTVKAFIRTTSNNKKDVNLRFRYSDGRDIQLFHKSEILVNEAIFDEKRECVKAKKIFDAEKRKHIDKAISDRKELIKRLCIGITDKNILTSEWLESSIDKELYPEKYDTSMSVKSFFDIFEEFLDKHKLSDVRKKNFRVVIRALKRYELYTRETGIKKKNFVLSLDDITPEILEDITIFLRKENEVRLEFPKIYEKCPEYHKPKPRGQNTINDIHRKLRTFFIWAADNGKTENNPFRKYSVEESVYGTPFYITIEERNKLYNTDLSQRPGLEIQRDIFVFQCLIGCRIADLYKLTKENVINGAVEYIAGKTKDDRPITVRVPLNAIAGEILAKYSNHGGEMLLPFISDQKYNKAIKEAFTIAGLTRPVVTLDTLTRESAIRPLNEIASSHLARRCFVGNLYKQVKDPNLVGALSGHKEGSRAFARYREIDEGMKQELVKMLE